MRIGTILLLLLLAACGGGAAPESGSAPAVEGARLFKAKGCYSCHSIGEGPKAGPDLKGLFARREEAWIRAYVSDPVAMVASDPIARGLKEQYKIQMPKMMISPQEMDALLGYLRSATQP
ncbi:MAG TPA: cytochrome c [bacterium]|nr:cytochrome c [bacterium]